MNEIENPPAFPTAQIVNVPAGHYWTQPAPSDGMTLRDYFAAAALTGQLTCIGNQADPEKRAIEAYKFADAMLAARSTPNQ